MQAAHSFTGALRGIVQTAGRPRWAGLSALLAGSLALGMVLLGPRLFSDPVGVDPYALRISAVSLGLLGLACWLPELRPARAVLLGLAAVCAPFSVWLAAPSLGGLWVGDRLSVPAELAIAGGLQTALVVLFIVAAARLPVDERPPLHLHGFAAGALLASVGGAAVFGAAFMLLPARLLGREALEPAMLARDALWMVPACALQAAAQEGAFRGVLLGALERGLPPWAANTGQAALFGIAHVAVQYEGPAGPFIPLTMALGLVLGVITQRTRSLWPAIIIHAVADIAVTLGVLPSLYGY